MKEKIKDIIIGVCMIMTIVVFTALIINLKNLPVVDKEMIMMSATKSEEKSEFDMWLTDYLEVKYVPSYIILDGTDIIGIINGGNGVKYFKEEYNKILDKHAVITNLPESLIYFPYKDNIIDLKEVLSNEINVIEIHKLSCMDCKIVDGVPGEYELIDFDEDGNPIEESKTILKIKNNIGCETLQLHRKINANFYRYYLKSNTSEIFERYN